ncbi:inositol 1,4,5-trisphosphate receptor-interacting protein-like 1 [Caloenas nicobarica]|uniref:inositol 1,4,5-trisphosphate receptor-interacting protein-like 1 n=1 Tax=Caloenas nicobarica TaxID=187106 RepID=UPI0032B86D0F
MEGPAARGSTLARARSRRRRRGWGSPCCLPAASAPLLPAPAPCGPQPRAPAPPAPFLPPSPTEPLLSLLLQAMAIMEIFFGVWQILTLNVQSVGYEPDEETRERMEQRAEMLSREMTRLWQEVEEMSQEQTKQEQSGFAWASLLLSALQHWQCWAVAGVLVLLFGLCWWLRKRSREAETQEESSDRDVEEEEDEEGNDDANDPGRYLEDAIERRVQNRDRPCKAVKKLVGKFIVLFNKVFFDTWYPVLEKAIEVGSAFEGWSPHEEDIPYCLLVPLKPPRGHIFHLEPCSMWPGRNFRVRVELVCTCETEQPARETRCFLHDPKEEQRRNEGPSILRDLCTGSYLDVQKTAEWFQKMVRGFWKDLPESAAYRLMPLPSERSCKFRVLRGWEKRFLIELVFGVREGDSDIFLSGQYIEAAYTSRTLWPETYAVAEMKFFRHIASQAQPDSFHLRCLQLCDRNLVGRDFSAYALKTAVMHLLTTKPLSHWREGILLERLEDIMGYLQSCLKKRCLNHFFIANENVPEEIILPLDLRTAEPLNIFQHLAQNPNAHEKARLEFEEMRRRIRGLLLHGR